MYLLIVTKQKHPFLARYTKNGCAGEAQQEITAPLCFIQTYNRIIKTVLCQERVLRISSAKPVEN
jgi:hypothetical protein